MSKHILIVFDQSVVDSDLIDFQKLIDRWSDANGVPLSIIDTGESKIKFHIEYAVESKDDRKSA